MKESIRLRGLLMIAIQAKIIASEMTQKEVAQKLGLTQPRVSNLMNSVYIAKFSLDYLVDAAYLLGIEFKAEIVQ